MLLFYLRSFCMRVLSGTCIYGGRSFFGLSKRMKITFRSLPVFMPQDFLDRSEWNSAAAGPIGAKVKKKGIKKGVTKMITPTYN